MLCLRTGRQRVPTAPCTLREAEQVVCWVSIPQRDRWCYTQTPSRSVFWKEHQGSSYSCYYPTFLLFNISCALLLSVGERHKYHLVLVLNTSSCLFSQPCRQHYPSSWHHHCLIHLTHAPEKNVVFWTRSQCCDLIPISDSSMTPQHLPFLVALEREGPGRFSSL